MTQSAEIRLNTLFSFLSISSRLIANVIVFWIIARNYGPSLFGQFTFAQTLATIFIIVADFGFDILLTNDIASDRVNAKNYFQKYFTLKIVFTSFAILGMWIFALITEVNSQTMFLIFIFSLYMAFTALTNFIFALFKGFEKLSYETRISLVINVSLLVGISILIYFHVDILYVAILFLITRVIGFWLGLKYASQVLVNISFKPTFPKFGEARNKILVYGFHLVFSYLFFQLDTILLAIFKGDYEIGIYQSVFKIIMIFLVIPEIFVNALLPVLSRLNTENPLQWTTVAHLMNKILVFAIIPITIFLFVFAERIISLIYGLSEYSESVMVLRIFAIILLVRFNLETFALMLTTSNKQKTRMYVVIVASVLNLTLNSFLIPDHGVNGAALVSLITNLFVGVIYIYMNRKLFIKWMVNSKVILLILISLTTALVLWEFDSQIIFYLSPIFGIIYLVLIYLYYLTEDDRYLLFSDKIKILTFKQK